jgi:hypothetical protein
MGSNGYRLRKRNDFGIVKESAQDGRTMNERETITERIVLRPWKGWRIFASVVSLALGAMLCIDAFGFSVLAIQHGESIGVLYVTPLWVMGMLLASAGVFFLFARPKAKAIAVRMLAGVLAAAALHGVFFAFLIAAQPGAERWPFTVVPVVGAVVALLMLVGAMNRQSIDESPPAPPDTAIQKWPKSG